MAPGLQGGQDDFNEMFDLLDLSKRGYLTLEEVQNFYQTLFYKAVHDDLLKSILNRYGGSQDGSRCTKNHFEEVLLKLEEGRNLEESLYWDFIALDRDGYRLVPVKSCLLLARSARPDFSLQLWHDWLNFRLEPNAPLSWCEFQKFLYLTPGEQSFEPTAEEVLDEEFQSLDKREEKKIDQKFHEFRDFLEGDDEYASKLLQDREAYHENIQYESNRLLNRWDIGGAEAVLYDDGTVMDRPSVVSETKNTLTVSDLISALDVKYNMLRQTVLFEMAKMEVESDSPGMAVSNEIVEKFLLELKKKEKKARKLKTLDQMLSLPGAGIQHRYTAFGVMGETADAYLAKWEKAEIRFKSLRVEGKSTDEINRIYEKEIMAEMRGSTTNGELLIHLAKRQDEEKEYLLRSLKNVSGDSLDAERLAMYASLHQQCLRIEEQAEFEYVATSGCLAERKQSPDFERYIPDRSRQEKMSQLQIEEGGKKNLGRRVPEPSKPYVSHSKNLGLVDSWLEVTRLLAQKHAAERKVMVHFLLSNKLQADLIGIKNESQKELQTMRRDFTKQHENWKEASFGKATVADKAQQRIRHHEILSTASALYWENLRRSVRRSADDIRKIILGRLQVLQDIECDNVFGKMKKMSAADIYGLRKEIYRLIRDEHLENISDLVLGTVKISAEEKELVDLILSKYNKLRAKLFEGYLKKKNITDDKDREQLLEKLRIGEEKHRFAGNHAKLAKLCKDTFQIKNTLQEIMGPDMSRFKEESVHYLEEIKDSGRKRKLINEPPDLGNDPDSHKPRGNLISELHLRYEDEVETVLEKLRESNPQEKSFRVAAEAAWQQWEILRFSVDEDFLNAADAMGLCERTKLGEGKIKLRQDNVRYVRLAQERLMVSGTLNTKSLQAMSSSSTPAQSSLRRVLLCHAGDWKKLYELLMDESAEELREAAASMTEDEQTSRLAEINAKRHVLDTKSPDWQDDILALLEEAAAIKYVSRMQNLKNLGGGAVEITDTDVHVSVMADLQEEHDKDGYRWFQKALEDPESAGKIKDLAIAESKSCTNIFNVLCKYEGQADDDEILQALEDKYDSLRDKLLAEALMRQIGQKVWSEMSERERQERLFKLKMEERKLRKEGRYDELAKLLGDAAADEERLRNLMGMNREEYERKLAERLANRKRGGLVAIAEGEDEDGDGDPLTDLTSRYESEKEALLRMLAGQGARYLSEQERQRELARLRRELRKSEREERFGAAAMVLGLAERNAEMEKRLASDKKRQEELAKQRIAALKARSKKGKHFPMPTISEEDEKIIHNGSKTEMMDAVLSKLELLFEAERGWLVHILTAQNELKPDQTSIKENNPVKLAGVKSGIEISERLHEIDVKLPRQVNIHEYKMPLTEAGFLREALLTQELAITTPQNEINKENLDIKTLAILQEVQDRKSGKIMEEMAQMDNEKLIEMQVTTLEWAKKGISENIPATFFNVPDEDDLLQKALQGKFDAILTALVEKALIEKKGEKKWNSMSQPERDLLIAETMQKIKKLIAEGRTDEAMALLGEAAKNDPNAILAMFGLNSDDDERKKLEEERMERKKQRLADGMSEEEADKLMEEERTEDEEALKKRRRNILALLQYDLDAQKAALLRQMAEGDEKLEEERRRQLELARLRLQQRMMQRENDLEAIAHVMALSKMATDQLEAERQRQLELARKRLEAHRNGRGPKEEKVLPLKLPEGDDTNALVDVIIRELESKHVQERLVLMKWMTTDVAPGTEVRRKALEMDESPLKKRIQELGELRRQWRNDDPENLKKNAQEQMEILVEAAALNLELMMKKAEISTENEAQEEILAQLQKQQMLESAHLINDLPGKNAATLRTIAQVQWRARAEEWLDNVAESLLRKSDMSAEESEIVKALEDKYDAIKDKLIAEALMRQMGEKEWREMSERERQKKIMELKMQERKLRQEGKLDEAAALLSSLIKSEEDIARLLGEAKLSQKEELEKRLEKRRQLKEQRLAAGLAVDDATLDAEMAKIDEEEKQKRKNVLLLLEHNLDEERDAILAGLRKHDEVVSAERKRQLELARLRRDQKQIAREDQFHAAAIIFNQAKRAEETLAENMAESRAKQLALAKDRLAARKARKEEREAARKLFDFDAITQRLRDTEEEEQDTSLSAPERLVQEMEAKQVNERENLLLFLLSTEMDSEMRMQVSSMTNDQIKAEQKKLADQRAGWREKRFIDLLQGKEEPDERRRTKKRDHLAKSIVEENTNLKRHMILQLEAQQRKNPDQTDFAIIKNEMSVKWLADVQTSQATAVDAVNTLIADKSDEVLDMITYGQRKSRIESWNDNVIKVVMGILPPGQMAQPSIDRQPSSLSTGSSEGRTAEETEKQIQSLDEELEEQRNELEKRKNIGEDIDMEAALNQLQQQHDAKKKALSSDLERQKQRVRDRLAARREQREEMEYEAHAAAAMVFLAERRLQDQKAHQQEEKTRHKNMMEERLEARRKRREEAKKRQEEEEQAAAVAKQEAKKKPMMAPPMGLVREKTVVDVQISKEDEEKALREIQETANKFQERMLADREKQRRRVQRRLEKTRAKSEERRDDVERIFANFEREKTIVLEKKELEFQRQKTMLQDRMHNIRTGKTKTMKERGDQKVRDFDKLVNQEDSQGLSKDEKMAIAAENLQKKFLAEKEMLETSSSPRQERKLEEEDNKESPEPEASPKPTRMTDEDRMKKMKQRMSIKKKQKQEEEGRLPQNPEQVDGSPDPTDN